MPHALVRPSRQLATPTGDNAGRCGELAGEGDADAIRCNYDGEVVDLDSRLDRILEQLRQRGGRVTTARRAVVTALLEADGHMTAQDLTATVQAAHPDVHPSTVYRCLDALTSLNVIDHVHLGHGPAVYHLVDQPHQHLVCDRCGVVQEVPDELFVDLDTRLADAYGFTMRRAHFAVVGRCRRCRAKA